MAIKIKGFDKHITVPVSVLMVDDFELTFRVEFERMTRTESARIFKQAKQRLKEVTKLETRLTELGAQLDAEQASDAVDALQRQIEQVEARLEKLRIQDDRELVDRIRGWSELVDDDGKEIAFSKKVLLELMDNPAVHQELMAAQFAATGAQVKN